MNRLGLTLTATAGAVFFTAAAIADEAPRVAVDIAPVHALVAKVMEGVGTPQLVLPPSVSPHGHMMRPSEARALDRADLIVMVGGGLIPSLSRSVAALSDDTKVIALAEAPGVTLHPVRTSPTFAPHDHDHDDHGHDHHDEHHGEAEHHEESHHEEAHHEDAAIDPHLWLDPDNAKATVDIVAERLALLDPSNAATYADNAATAKADLDALATRIETTLAPVKARPFVVFHDAYQYFEVRFGTAAIGAISLSDATAPSASRVSEVRSALAAMDAHCVFAEPQFNSRIAETIVEDTPVQLAILDPLGVDLEPGQDHYHLMMERLAGNLATCLASDPS